MNIEALNFYSKKLKMKFDHYSIPVSDLDESAAFYKDILSLPEIENKTRKDYIRWFGLEGHELHLIEDDITELKVLQNLHFALTTTDLEGLLSRLKERDIPYFNSRGEEDEINIRPDGIRQIYFRDPNGHWLEVNDVAAHE